MTQTADYASLRSAPHKVGDWMSLPHVSLMKTVEVYIRECYELLYMDIQDYFSIGQRFVHISGNPGTGKSCFLWYVLVRILNDPAEQGNAVILQLVEDENRRTFQILPGGEELIKIDNPEASPYYTRKGTWLLTDQKFVGYAAAKTVLFASPRDDNWGKAVRLLDESKFTQLFMPPWSLEELKIFFFHFQARSKADINEFWVRFYLSGHIVRWYSFELTSVYSQLMTRVTKVVSTEKTVNATLFRGAGVDKGILCSWPSLDYSQVKSYTFISEFVADCFATACFRGDLKDWNTELLKLASDPDLRCAAGILFERYVHYRLSGGGFFPSVDDPEIGLELQTRPAKYFSGKTFPLRKQYLDLYLQRWDSAYLPNILVQISMAKTRKPIPKGVYEAQILEMKEFWELHPNAKSGLRGISDREVYAVLVKLAGDDHTSVPDGLQVWEPAPPVEEEENSAEDSDDPESSRRLKRKRLAIQSRKPRVAVNLQTELTKQKKTKRIVTPIPFQMTIALKQEDASEVSYEPLDVVYRNVKDRILYERNAASKVIDGTDTGAKEFGDIDNEEEELDQVQVLMRQGEGFAYYEELEDDGKAVFAVSVTATRQTAGDDETTELAIDCSAGRLDQGRELRIFVDERRGTEIRYDDPVAILVTKDNVGVLETASDVDTGDRYEVRLNPEQMTVKIVCKRERHRFSKYFSVCVLNDEANNTEDVDED